MKQLTVVIDGGTTNMRAILMDENNQCLGIVKRQAGLRDVAVQGGNAILIDNMVACLKKLYCQTGVTENNIKRILVCGGLSTEMGICNVEYVPLPADKYDLYQAMGNVLIPEISSKPLQILPGVKTQGNSIDDLPFTDAMKGEEAEAIAAYEALGSGDYLFIFPGSHTKIALMNRRGKIIQILGCLTGEMLAAISQHTLIANCVNHQFLKEGELVEDALLRGCAMTRRFGLTRAAFSARMLSRFYDRDYLVVRSFLLGAVLQNDIQAIEGSEIRKGYENVPIYIIGSGPMQRAFELLLHQADLGTDIRNYTTDGDIPLTGIGSCLIAAATHRAVYNGRQKNQNESANAV